MRLFTCTNCELPTLAQHGCPCNGGPAIPRVDGRPVLLEPAVRQWLSRAVDLHQQQAQQEPGTLRAARLLRVVIPHYLRLIADHQKALRWRAEGRAVQTLPGTVEDQLCLLARPLPPLRRDAEALKQRAVRAGRNKVGNVVFLRPLYRT